MSNDTKTHVECDPSWPAEPLGRINNVLTEGCGSVEAWDFSLANSSYEARVYFVTKVASICYGNPKALSSINLFNRLEAESHGLPSSSYEFVPILLSNKQLHDIACLKLISKTYLNVTKYGEIVQHTYNSNAGEVKVDYLLTNLRALIADVGVEESLKYFNTSEKEIEIIKENFKVFLFKVDLATRAQMVRHRVSWQELSRRYVSGKKQPFEFYISKKMENLEHEDGNFGRYSTEWIIQTCIAHYDAAIASGIKPEEARRILPQAMMTTIWGAFQPSQLDNWFQLRLHKTAQREIRHVAEAMKELTCLIGEPTGYIPPQSQAPTTGMKFDTGKLMYSLIPVETTQALAEVLSFGASKYAPDNWKLVENGEQRYLDALYRHLQAYRSGESHDPESGLHHLSHALTNIAFLHYLTTTKKD